MNDLTIFGIETSGKTASVSILKENCVLYSETVFTTLTHSQTLIPMCERAIKSAGISFSDIDRIAVSEGPGSYTGLRIGIAAVKGMCLKGDIFTCGVSTLKAMAYNLLPFEGIILCVMKARENIAYFGIYRSDGEKIETVYDDSVSKIHDIKDAIDGLNGKTVVVGDWAEFIKKELFADDEKIILAPTDKLLQDAKGVCLAALAENKFYPASDLNAKYLQITKAEKDRLK